MSATPRPLVPKIAAAGEPANEPAQDSPPRPHLASEALIEDLAPREPWKTVARALCLGLGLTLVAAGGLLELGPRAGLMERTVPAALLGGLAIVAGVTPVSYRQRALALVTLAYIAGLLGLRNLGPAAGLAVGGSSWGLFRLVASTALPAALLFRATYRAYAPARWILAGAFLLSTPFVIHSVAALLTEELHLSHAGTLAALAAAVAGLAGFMGSETTGAGSYIAGAVVLSLTAALGLELLDRAHATALDATVTAAAFLAVATLGTVGLFQLLAARFAADARTIDTRRTPPPRSRPPASEPPTSFLSED